MQIQEEWPKTPTHRTIQPNPPNTAQPDGTLEAIYQMHQSHWSDAFESLDEDKDGILSKKKEWAKKVM